MVNNPKIGMYLVDKQYKNTIYIIVNKVDASGLYCIDVVEGSDDHGMFTWFDLDELNRFFIEIEYNDTTKALYGNTKIQNRG